MHAAFTVPDLCELPDWMGRLMHAVAERRLAKAAGHKYIRRIPTGNPKRPWRYFYAITGGKTLGHEEEIKRGAKFRMRDAGKEGHFEVTSEDGDKITVKHDESGASHEMTRAALASMLKEHHAEAIGKVREKLAHEVKSAREVGTEKQQAQVEKRARTFQETHGGLEEAERHRMVRPEDLREKARAAKTRDAAEAARKQAEAAAAAAKEKASEGPRPFLVRPEPKEERKPRKESTEREGGGKGSQREHKEVGEHVFGSRADLAQLRSADDLTGMSNTEARRLVTKDRLAPSFDEAAFRSSGGTPGAAHLINYLLGTIASKPDDSDEARRAYMHGLDLFTKTMERVTTVEGVVTALQELMEISRGRVELHRTKDRREAERFPGGEAISHDYSDRARGDFTVTYVVLGTKPGTLEIRNGIKALGPRLAKMLGLERRAARSEAWAEARIAARKMDEAGWPEGEAAAPAAETAEEKAKPFRWEQHVSGKPERIDGPGVEKPDAAALAKEFQFANVQFGNWVSDDAAKHHLVAAHNAMRDLSEVLGITPEALTFGGELAIGFGARGAGKARAHYEAGGKIINLTKFAGGGSLAHEWGHYLDNAIAERHQDQTRASTSGDAKFVSHNPGSSSLAMAPAVRQAFSALMTAIQGSRYSPTSYVQHATALGGKSTDSYWSRSHELFARAWESYVQDKLEDNGRRNSYLVDGTREQYATGRPVTGGPRGSRHPEVQAAIAEVNAHTDKVNKSIRAKKQEFLAQGAEDMQAHNDAIKEHAEQLNENKRLREKYKKLRSEGEVKTQHAQPYPQGEERAAINRAFEGLVGAIRGAGILAPKGDPIPLKEPKQPTEAQAKLRAAAEALKVPMTEPSVTPVVEPPAPTITIRPSATDAELARMAQSADPRVKAAAEKAIASRKAALPSPEEVRTANLKDREAQRKRDALIAEGRKRLEEKNKRSLGAQETAPPKVTITVPATPKPPEPAPTTKPGGFAKPEGHAAALAMVQGAGAKIGHRGDHGFILEKVTPALAGKLRAAGATEGRTTWTVPPAAVTKLAGLQGTPDQVARQEPPKTQVGGAETKVSGGETFQPSPRGSSAPKLRALAEAAEARARETLSHDRKTNTSRRARMAAGVEDDARAEQAKAKTLRKIADGQEAGRLEHLGGVSTRAQVDTLESLLRQAKYRGMRKRGENTGNADSSATAEDAAHAEYPHPDIHKDHIKDIARAVLEMPPAKRAGVTQAAKALGAAAERLGDREWRVKLDTPELRAHGEALAKFTEENIPKEKYGAKSIREELREYKRVADLGIHDERALRAALAEYAGVRGTKEAPDAVREAIRGLAGRKIAGYFPTPPSAVQRVMEHADIQRGQRVLEPSAGVGYLADAAKAKGAEVEVGEINSTLRTILEAKGHKLVASDATEHKSEPGARYDRVVMNPPFERGQDGEHVQHAFEQHLAPGGKLVAIVSEHPFFADDPKARAFRAFLEKHGGTSEKLPAGTFKSSDNPTGVNTRIVVIKKPGGETRMAKSLRAWMLEAA